MKGIKPRPPADWSDSDGGGTAAKSEAEEPKARRDETSGPIGGPAGEH